MALNSESAGNSLNLTVPGSVEELYKVFIDYPNEKKNKTAQVLTTW
jgi:hypothetical protein